MNKSKKYNGVVVPMVSPFTEDKLIDLDSTEVVVNHIIDGGAFPFILGTTGEFASLSRPEKKKLVHATVIASKGRRMVYAGISNNSIRESIREAKLYSDLGVKVVVSTMPSYYPVEADQILKYFEELADAVPLPLIIYNIPSTTNLSIPLEVVNELSGHSNIVGFKDSENDFERAKHAIALWQNREDFSYLIGSASLSQAALTLGADGIVPSSGNLVPRLYNKLYNASKDKNEEKASSAQEKTNLISSVYQKNRILSKALPALKVLMSVYGLCKPEVKPPMYKVERDEENELRREMLSLFPDLNQLNN